VKRWDADFVREELGIPGCRALLRLDKEVRRAGELLSFETRYFVSSLDPVKVSASEFQEIIQGHWEVENCLHWQKDRYFEEDKHVLRHGGDVWTVLTNMALSLTRLLRSNERTLREVAERCLADPTAVAERLGLNQGKT
jgi:predicted transposase YbfD/YdcC